MALDFNDASEQSSGGRTIPPHSKVCVTLEIQYPDANHQGREAREFSWSGDPAKMEYLNTTLVVQSPSFSGVKIFQRYNLGNATTERQKKAVSIARSSIRAIIEAARGIAPSDVSPQARQARMINSYAELHGMRFFAEVGCEQSAPNKNGKVYMNNTVLRIVTVDDIDMQTLRSTGEVISNNPVPEIQEQPAATSAAAGWNPPASGAPAQPAWAQSAPATNRGQYVQTVPTSTDDVPF